MHIGKKQQPEMENPEEAHLKIIDELDPELYTEEERQYWKKVLKDTEKEISRNDRRNRTHRDYYDMTWVECGPEQDQIKWVPRTLISYAERQWIDRIFSQRPEDLHELVTDEKLSRAIQMLTKLQKEVLFLNVVHRFSTVEVGNQLGMSDRNVRKHRKRAIEAIHRQLPILAEQQRKKELQQAKAKKDDMWYSLLQILQKG